MRSYLDTLKVDTKTPSFLHRLKTFCVFMDSIFELYAYSTLAFENDELLFCMSSLLFLRPESNPYLWIWIGFQTRTGLSKRFSSFFYDIERFWHFWFHFCVLRVINRVSADPKIFLCLLALSVYGVWRKQTNWDIFSFLSSIKCFHLQEVHIWPHYIHAKLHHFCFYFLRELLLE